MIDCSEEKRAYLLIFSSLFYACNTLNIYLAIKFILSDEVLYPLFFFLILLIDKIIILLASTFSRYRDLIDITLFIADFFQLGTLYLRFQKEIPKINHHYKFALIMKIIPMLLSQTIFYFYQNGILSNPNISDADLILSQINYVILIILAAVCCLRIFETELTFLENLIHLFTGYFLWSSLFLTTQDIWIFNLGYCHFLLILIETVILGFFKCNSHQWYQTLITLLSAFAFVSNSSYPQNSLDSKIRANFLSYFNIIIYFILICVFGGNQIFSTEGFSTLEAFQIIKSIHCKVAFIFGCYFTVCFLKQFLLEDFTHKTFYIYDQQDVLQVHDYFKQKHKYLRFINIQIRGSFRNSEFKKSNSHIDYFLVTEQENLVHYKWLKSLNEFCLDKRNQLTLKIKKYNFISMEDQIKIYSEQPEIANTLKRLFYYYLKQNYLLEIMRIRISKGLILTQLSSQLIRGIKNNKDRQPFCKTISEILQITVFRKYLAREMTFSSPQILYDLYVDSQ